MDTDPIEDQATAALDAILPRRDPRYGGAQVYLMAYLSTDPATRRLAMRALKAASPDTEHDQAASLPAAGGAPESGEVPAPETRAVHVTLACGGKACEVRDGKEIHRPDPSCSKLTGRRAARG